jgi:hypothetical protein
MAAGFDKGLCQRQAETLGAARDDEDLATDIEFFEAHWVCGRVGQLLADG